MLRFVLFTFLIINIFVSFFYIARVVDAGVEGLRLFEYISCATYLIDIAAFSLLLMNSRYGFWIIIITSFSYFSVHWYEAFSKFNILAAAFKLTSDFYIFLFISTVTPFVDVFLIFFLGKKRLGLSRQSTSQKAGN